MPPLQIIETVQAPHFSLTKAPGGNKTFSEKFSAFKKRVIARSGVIELKTFE
jgi:hypothetical protein